MNNALKQTPKINERGIEANALQARASNPKNSSWVSASAGSGKTKVLTDRILRLLLPRDDGSAGTPLHKILALTFTKAAASEMAIRIQDSLSGWVNSPDEELIKDLTSLLGRAPNDRDINAARRLFAQIIEAKGGIPIMTIHSFCQSILSRFPLEAGLSPQINPLIESESAVLIQKSYRALFDKSNREKGSDLTAALDNILTHQNQEQFEKLIKQVLSERAQLKSTLQKYKNTDGFYSALCLYLDVIPDKSIDAYYIDYIHNTPTDNLYLAIETLIETGGVRNTERADWLKNWIEQTNKTHGDNTFEEYKKIFFKADGDLRPTIASKKIITNTPHIEEVLINEQNRLVDFIDKANAVLCAALTRDIFIIGQEFIATYEELKNKISALDFDDLILKTLDLLSGQTLGMNVKEVTPWVRFKLDQGIDHILIDEAQDTNPEQWEIIKALSDDFFDGQSAADTDRTIFVVGDEKQSIYSFQRASPEKFSEMRDWFHHKINDAGKVFDPVDINISFRTVRSILETVDAVFEPHVLKNNQTEIIQHKAYRSGQPGFVELWPVFETDETTQTDVWAPPIDLIESHSGASKLANHIAETIDHWLQTKQPLESHDRAIKPGDIMILMRTRTPFIDQLVKALKSKKIPVSGVDRMVLNNQLIIQDLCAAASFALLPDDDLSLACLLKSPFIGFDDETLETIAYGRDGSLWQSLKNNKAYVSIIEWLENLIKNAALQSPFDFITALYQSPCPASPKSGLIALKQRLGNEIIEPLNEFLNTALDYEHDVDLSLQGFIHARNQDSSDIKRELEEAGDAVRIMTIHASKGLQAPIVILPDTFRNAAPIIDPLIWPKSEDMPFALLSTKSELNPNAYSKQKEFMRGQLNQEYKRLLYVAMTRAENRLYIGGHTGKKKPLDESWYYYIRDAFDRLDGIETLPDNAQRYLCVKSDEPDKTKKSKNLEITYTLPTPDWLFEKAPIDPTPPRPLVPSRPSQNIGLVKNDKTSSINTLSEPPVLSPLKTDDQYRFLRGNITHTLLQMLPNITPDNWSIAAKTYIERTGQKLTKDVQQSVVDETLAILKHTEFAPIFGENSVAEAPITGLIDGKTLLSGQIDRLLITDNLIYIIDFKTNRPPPKDPKDVPLIYMNQMRSYAEALALIYPNRRIKAALLWTDGPNLMEIDLDK